MPSGCEISGSIPDKTAYPPQLPRDFSPDSSEIWPTPKQFLASRQRSELYHIFRLVARGYQPLARARERNLSVSSSKCPRTCGSIETKNTKTVLVLDGQAEANVAAKFFVSREDEVRVRRRGKTRRVEAYRIENVECKM